MVYYKASVFVSNEGNMAKNKDNKVLLLDSTDSDMEKVLATASKKASDSMAIAQQIHRSRLQAIKRSPVKAAADRHA